MKVSEVVFQDLLNGQTQYYIPLFQRNYTWQEEELLMLWNDLIDIYNLEDKKSHFIGAFVTMPMIDSPDKCKKFTLIDGQQRIATLLILLSVIRDFSNNYAEEYRTLAQQIDDECLINKYSKDNKEHLKLILTQQDREEFECIISKKIDISGSNKSLIFKAYKFFYNLINRSFKDQDPFNLNTLKSCITDYITLVSITLDINDSPYKIFESLNHKGVPLIASDLIRNYVFMHVDKESQEDIYSKKWTPMQFNVNEARGNEKELDFFFWRYLMKDGRLVREDDVYHEIVNDIQKNLRKNDIYYTIDDYYKYSEYYLSLIAPEKNEKNKKIKKLLQDLYLWKADVVYPFLLNIWDDKAKAAISEEQIIETLSIILSFLVRRYICDKPSNSLRSLFSSLIKNKDLNFYLRAIVDELANEWPQDDLFFKYLCEKELYKDSYKDRTKMILSRIEESFYHKENVDTNRKDINIEHIMPQKLNEEWMQDLGSNSKEVHKKYLHTLGNLTLTGYNQKLDNDAFYIKKITYKDSHFEITKLINKYNNWTENEICERSKELANRALLVWKGPKSYIKK